MNTLLSKKEIARASGETVFDLAYLSTVLVCGLLLLQSAAGGPRWQFGVMALVLFFGDATHLLPRIYVLWRPRTENAPALLGVGKLIASVTMTVFYVLLWNLGARLYGAAGFLTAIIYVLAALRIALCLFPQNRWFSPNPPLSWAVWRNVPFILMGLAVMVLFAARAEGSLACLWIAVLLSFAFYIPVVLYAGKNPKIGMLMLPKSCAYAAIVVMGLSLPL